MLMNFIKIQYYCKICSAQISKQLRQQYKENNKNREIDPNYIKKCFICKQIKNSTEYYKHASNKDGLNSRCKECNKLHNNTNKIKK